MHPKSPRSLDTIARSCRYILEDTADASLSTWLAHRQMRQAVERNLEIIGEALMRLRDIDPKITKRISDVHQIIGLRNRLAHGYEDEIDDELVWITVRESLPTLKQEVDRLLPVFEE